MESFVLFNSICKFGIFKNPFAMVTCLSDIYFRLRRFLLLVKTKKSNFYELWQQHRQLKTIEMTEAWPIILTMSNIYISSNPNPLTNFTSSSRRIEFKDIHPWNISHMITKTIPISTRIAIRKWHNVLRNRAFRCEFDRKSIKTKTKTWSELPSGARTIVKQILASEEWNKSKKAGLWESQSEIWVAKLTIWVMSIEIEKI